MSAVIAPGFCTVSVLPDGGTLIERLPSLVLSRAIYHVMADVKHAVRKFPCQLHPQSSARKNGDCYACDASARQCMRAAVATLEAAL